MSTKLPFLDIPDPEPEPGMETTIQRPGSAWDGRRRCQGTTANGTQCQRPVLPGKAVCFQHSGDRPGRLGGRSHWKYERQDPAVVAQARAAAAQVKEARALIDDARRAGPDADPRAVAASIRSGLAALEVGLAEQAALAERERLRRS